MKPAATKIKKRQTKLLALIGVGTFGIVAAFTYLTSKPGSLSSVTKETRVDLPGKDLNPEDVRISSLESKNEFVEAKMKCLEKMFLQQKKAAEEQEKKKQNFQEEIQHLKQELNAQATLSPPIEEICIPPIECSPPLPIPYKLEFYVREEQETEYGNVESTIPAGTTARAILLSSVDAPCGVHSSTDPQPVKLRILDNAKLPKGVQAKLKGTILIGSAYGNLSSERIYIRVERMTQVKKNGDFVETDVTGFVSGEDGKYGMRGVVVDRSDKLIASAAIAGFLDGINQYLQATINAQTLAKSTQGLPSRDVINLEVLKSSSLNGVSTGLDKLSDYYIQRAEQLQPVIQIAAGRVIDITFTHSTELGDLHTKDKVKELRERSRENG
ncbi:MAG: hypothetical protein K1000chlam3_00463 [Chlamydiae bacterium]|nr:hypothetical protein [Chlamydiota bacterium]